MTDKRDTTRLRLLLFYGLLSLAAVAAGCAICAMADVPTGSWLRNLVAWAVGFALAGALAALAGRRTSAVFLVVALLVVLASLFGPPQQGVHRWLDVGPLHINVAFIVLPMAVVALSWRVGRLWVWAPALGVQALLAVQPDASQAAAFGIALAIVAVRSASPVWVRIGVPVTSLALAVIAWLRPDPLEAVPEVEEIVALGFSVSPLLAIAGVILTIAAVLAPTVAARRTPDAASAGLALSGYMFATAATTVSGAFPMPLLGIGMSPIVGFWLGVGLLAAMVSRTAASSPASGS
ncbi:cell division protein FtsW (lipid II flippase) [Brevundimonas alba]|uniref:Cell division protein FtsW (Lipid II flippase) n=1 Tax=Brevundimonas alba TaxID=74314 RepID=A0A7X5YNH7_9CAUL|nr:hypothetical protein [Brevundimonas alba]NJC41919.1 cell division protein FtsW (lipid II flippase) [Brevundimonas alba]